MDPFLVSVLCFSVTFILLFGILVFASFVLSRAVKFCSALV